MIVPTCFVIATGFLDESQREAAVAFLTISVGHLGLVRAGHRTNQIDIAPKYAITTMSL